MRISQFSSGTPRLPTRPRSARDAATMRYGLHLITACLLSGVAGCANPGIPKPPSLHIPATVTDLTGQRVGDRVMLHWTSPSRTTDGLDLTGPTTVEICRDAPMIPQPGGVLRDRSGAAAASGPCLIVLGTPGHSGDSTALVPLPANALATAGPPQISAYRVRILNTAGRSAAPSAPVLIPGGPTPLPVAGFRAVQRKNGVLLEWDRLSPEMPHISDMDEVEIERMSQTPPPPQDNQPQTAGRNGKAKKADSSSKTGEADSAVVSATTTALRRFRSSTRRATNKDSEARWHDRRRRAGRINLCLHRSTFEESFCCRIHYRDF